MIQSIGLTEFGLRLRSLREQHSYSQGDMANILEISRTSYLAIEQGKRDVGLIEIQKIAVAFQMHLEVLLHGGISSELQYSAREKTIVAGEPKGKYQESELVFNEEKCRALVLYVIESCARIPQAVETVIPKLMYLIDFAYFENHECFLSTSTYKKLPFGPMPEEFGEILDDLLAAGDIVKVKIAKNGIVQHKFFPMRTADLSILKASEIVLMNDIIQHYGRLPAEHLAELLHKDVPMKVTGMGEIINYELTFYREFPFSYRIYGEEDGGANSTIGIVSQKG